MSLGTPQNITDLRLNFGFYLSRPQDIFPEHISPGVDTEIYDQGGGKIGGINYQNNEQGTGHILVEEN